MADQPQPAIGIGFKYIKRPGQPADGRIYQIVRESAILPVRPHSVDDNIFKYGRIPLGDFILLKQLDYHIFAPVDILDDNIKIYNIHSATVDTIYEIHHNKDIPKLSGDMAARKYLEFMRIEHDDRYHVSLIPYITLHVVVQNSNEGILFIAYYTFNKGDIYTAVFNNPDIHITELFTMIFDDHGKLANMTLQKHNLYIGCLAKKMLNIDIVRVIPPHALMPATELVIANSGLTPANLGELFRMTDIAENGDAYPMHFHWDKVYEINGYYYVYYNTDANNFISAWTDRYTDFKCYIPHGGVIVAKYVDNDARRAITILKSLVWLAIYCERHPATTCAIIINDGADAGADRHMWHRQMARLFPNGHDYNVHWRLFTYNQIDDIPRAQRDILIIDKFSTYITNTKIFDEHLLDYKKLHALDTPFKLVLINSDAPEINYDIITLIINIVLGGDADVYRYTIGTEFGRQQMRQLYIT